MFQSTITVFGLAKLVWANTLAADNGEVSLLSLRKDVLTQACCCEI
jgi:hypothetical protein